MGTITREELWRRLKAGRVEPLYLLFGPENYLRDAAARAVADAALKGAALREFNESSYSLAGVDVQQAIAAAEQLPMMGARRVVRVSDFARLRDADEEALVRYVTRPAESSVVVFIAGELDRRRALATLSKLLDDGAEPVMLIGLLASSYHRLALAKDLMARGAPNEEVFRIVPMPLGKRKDFLATARRADARELERRLRRIAE